jgi:hypothetical protein
MSGSISIRKRTPDDYLSRLEDYKLQPTFWSSPSYLNSLELRQVDNHGTIWLEEDGLCLFPPIAPDGTYDFSPDCIWAIPSGTIKTDKVLDWEYLYRADDFKNLSGGKWEVFRKNSRKWSKGNPRWRYEWAPTHQIGHCFDLLGSWLSSKPEEEEIQDSDTILRYLKEHQGFTFNLWSGDKLVGINVYDWSWKYMNFRYSFYDSFQPYLSEFLRLLFYQRAIGIINDGGTLGNSNLERFKDKLNPFQKSPIYSKMR